ncbi:SDR family oxidoreductase [Chromobacterium haemolyticum]|uniref:SDR family oxidoreductase n=1 Tax=Chromobacterium haemolyticum TaxID=394935 RepID=A0ABS3GLQ5_9NEIS|nr:SDR family oxidoreductase [Chromobacterium haemolyticum]MBK0414402.1 SDR family oxidoreductase [Chromobacterium haemolyticum]MBO0415964.1 SDR family oxidoreductase [Chromobacterium haemolyticum]MBO0499224.1 SDR family oxidoreductase [Chromobacterium haemolyticum]
MGVKVVLITGASRGIGAATARLAAVEGWRVAVNYRLDQTGAEAVVAELRQAGADAEAFCADVSLEADIVGLFDAVAAHFGRLDALVNNAGVTAPIGRLEDYSAQRVEQVLRSNVLGPVLCCREAVRRMSTRHGGVGGAIVNVSSAASRLGSAGEYVDYAASKGAIDTLTLGLAGEVAAEGIRVNAVRPGLIHTGIHAASGEPGRVERLAGSVPMGRGGAVEEVAAAIVWLLSDASSFCTGSLLDVSGGR